VEAVITDFGLVRIMNAATQTVSGTVSGTPAYMSPEQARGDSTDHRTDIYSLGIVLYEMLAGRVPFEADSTLTILHMQVHTTPPPIPGISPAVQAVMDRALQKNPADRYPTGREFATNYYRSIGMVLKVDTIREPYPVRAEPIEAPAPPIPKLTTEPGPAIKPQLAVKAEPATEPEPKQKQERSPKPARSRAWIGVGLLSLIVLSLLVFGASRLLSAGPISPSPTQTLSPAIPETVISPLPSETLGQPEATGMVKVDAGTYVVGKDAADNYHSASQSIPLPEFWIDEYQVTNQEFQQFMVEWQIPPEQEKFPVMGVKWEEADSYCKSLNKRLPREAEWEAAGRGRGENPPLYPWGDNASRALELPNHAYPVGSFDFNRSPFEVYDMIRNVYEWVGEPYYASVEAGKKLLRGVRAGNTQDITFRVQVAPEDTTYIPYAGFRCAADQVR
jgi:formylglycine-generating enzyme required for sulfatase activity